MSKYKQFFTEHSLIRKRILEICKLLNLHNPKFHPKFKDSEMSFKYDGHKSFEIYKESEHYAPEDYCIIDIEWLDATDEDILKEILNNVKYWEDYCNKYK